MAMIQFRKESTSPQQPDPICITKRMHAPKYATLEAWFKAARRIIPEIPNPKNSSWAILNENATVKWIRFELVNNTEERGPERCYVIIDRQVPAIGV